MTWVGVAFGALPPIIGRRHVRSRHEAEADQGTRKTTLIGVGLTLCRHDHPAPRCAPHNVIPGSPGNLASGAAYGRGQRRQSLVDLRSSAREVWSRRPEAASRHDAVFCSGYEAGRRRSSRVVAALQSTTYATTLIGRRWAAGTPKRHSGPRRPVMKETDPGPRQETATGAAAGAATGTATGISDRDSVRARGRNQRSRRHRRCSLPPPLSPSLSAVPAQKSGDEGAAVATVYTMPS